MNHETKQTAMQELLKWVRKTLPMDLDFPQMIESKIESLIPMEKKQIIEAWIATDNELQRIAAEQYYNETFKQD